MANRRMVNGRSFLCNGPGRWQLSSHGYRWRMTRDGKAWTVSGPSVPPGTQARTWVEAAHIVVDAVNEQYRIDHQARRAGKADEDTISIVHPKDRQHLSPDSALHNGPAADCAECSPVDHDTADDVDEDGGPEQDPAVTDFLRSLTALGNATAGAIVGSDMAREAFGHAIAVEQATMRLAAVCPPRLLQWAYAEAARRRDEFAKIQITAGRGGAHPALAGLQSVTRDLTYGDIS